MIDHRGFLARTYEALTYDRLQVDIMLNLDCL